MLMWVLIAVFAAIFGGFTASPKSSPSFSVYVEKIHEEAAVRTLGVIRAASVKVPTTVSSYESV